MKITSVFFVLITSTVFNAQGQTTLTLNDVTFNATTGYYYRLHSKL